MEALLTLLFLIFMVLAWFLSFFGGIGTLLILLGALLYSVFTGFEIITPKVLLALALLYLTGELFDYAFVALGAKLTGASKKAMFGAIIGGLIGAAISLSTFGMGIVPLTLLGIFLGAFLVELKEKGDFLKALRAGVGSLIGRFGAVIFKVLIGLLMLGIIFYHILAYLK
jgi:hypothetical protein